MGQSKTRIVNGIINREGGYVDNPHDSGGKTKFGITEHEARAAGYTGLMSELPRRLAFDIYARKFWHRVNGDGLSTISNYSITKEVVDACVHVGPRRASRILQRALNVFNRRGYFYDDIVVDGSIGPATLGALEGYMKHRDSDVLCFALHALRGEFYISLSERREKDEEFTYGWFKRLLDM